MARVASAVGVVAFTGVLALVLVVALRFVAGCGVRLPLIGDALDFCAPEAATGLPIGLEPMGGSVVVGQRERVAALAARLNLQPICEVIAPPPPPAPEPIPESVTRVEREGGVLRALNVTLSWNGDADLDLFLYCPSGERIFHGNLEACGGKLQLDMNVSPEGNYSLEPVEDIVFEENAIPSGVFKVAVKLHSRGGGRAIPFEVVVRSDEGGGTILERFEAEVRKKGVPLTVGSFVARP